MRTLTDIANACGTDKGSVCAHNPPLNFTPAYELVMGHMRNLPIRILEIGVDKGASLAMWREYFPKAEVYGIDCEPKGIEGTFVADQASREQLRKVIAEIGDVDVIIDDGSHVVAHQQITLSVLLPHTKLYWIEDLHTSDPLWNGHWLYGNDMSFEAGHDTVSVLHDYMRTGVFRSPFLSEAENKAIRRTCHIFNPPPTRWGQNRLALLC